jgi:general secretion pathway protein I
MFQVPLRSSRFRVPGSGFFELGILFPNLERGTWHSALRPNLELRREAGFTLLEVIIALAILGVTFALAMQLLAAGVRSAKASEDYTHAALLARQKMGEIVMKSSFEGSADGGELGGGFRWVSEVQPLPQEEELPALLYRVWVRVTWPGRRGEKSLDLTTLRMAVDDKKLGQTHAVPPTAPSSRVR